MAQKINFFSASYDGWTQFVAGTALAQTPLSAASDSLPFRAEQEREAAFMRVLVVEDDRALCEVFAEFLRGWVISRSSSIPPKRRSTRSVPSVMKRCCSTSPCPG